MNETQEIYKIIWALNSMGDMNVCSCPKPSGELPESEDEVICHRGLCQDPEFRSVAEFYIPQRMACFLCSESDELERITLSLIGHALDRYYAEV